MNFRRFLPVILASIAIGILLFLLKMTQGVDPELHRQRLANIRAIDNLDIKLNRTLVEARFTSLAVEGGDRGAGGSERSQITGKLGDMLTSLDQGPHSLRGLNKELDAALDKFSNTIEDKFVLAFDFEARNSMLNQRLINSLDAVPAEVGLVLNAASSPAKDELSGILTQLKAEILTYAVTPTPTNASVIRELLDRMDKLGESQSAAYKVVAQGLHARSEEVLADKAELVDKLNNFLARPTGAELQEVERTYTAWHDARVATANQYRFILAGYAAILLLILTLVGVRLLRSFRELDRANETLEAQVVARTKDLSKTLQDLRASQTQLIHSEKMASLGQMVAGVAHEINTPLGYARSNTEIVRNSLIDLTDLYAAQTRALKLMASEDATDDQVAHAIDEVHSRIQSVNAEELGGELDGLLSDTDHGLLQIAELVSSLKEFSRVDRSRADLYNINDSLDSALKICQNQLKHRVEVVKHYGELPQIECSPSQVNQVFLNLFTNAAQAIEGEGKIFIHTFTEGPGVTIKIIDTGKGMPEDVRAKIFEPFFTTKPVGVGTGLGLSIVYGIIKDHDGTIDVRSTPGKGTEFSIHLPLKQKHKKLDKSQLEAPESAAA